MALHSFWCPVCGLKKKDILIGADAIMAHEEVCPECGLPMEYDYSKTGGHVPFPPFSIKYRDDDGSVRDYRMESLRDIRQFEKEREHKHTYLEAFSHDNFSGVDSSKGR